MFVKEGGEAFQYGGEQFFRYGGDDHHQYIVFVEHQVALMKAMGAFAGEVVDDGVALDAGAVQQVGGEGAVFAAQDDFQFLQRAEV